MKSINKLLQYADVSQSTASRLLAFFSTVTYVFLYGPVIVVAILSFTTATIPTFPPEGFTLSWYFNLFPPEPYNERIFSSLIESIQLGVITALVTGAIGTIASLGMVRNKFDNRWINDSNLRLFFIIPIVVPWIVTAVAILILYGLLDVVGNYVTLVIGHVLITLPFTILIVSAQLYGFDRSLEEAAMNLGASRLRTFYEITLPLIAPGIFAGMLFAFTLSFDNFTQTFFWATRTETLPIVIFSSIERGYNPSINAISTLIMLFSLTIGLIGERLSRRVIQ